MKLFGYDTITDIKPLYESESDGLGHTLFIEGIFAQAETPNRNNRIYPKNVLEHAIHEYGEEYVKNGRALGELSHPSDFSVNPERACILIKKLEWHGNDVYGKAKVLTDLPCGKIVKGLLDNGVVVGVSTRGAGSLKEGNGDYDIVDQDYIISAIDVVTNPSGIDCWIKGVNESVEYFMEDGKLSSHRPLLKSKADNIIKSLSEGDFNKLKKDFKIFLKEVENGLSK